MAEDGRSRLGRGLAALIGDVGDETQIVERARNARKAPIEHLKPNPRNPRRMFATRSSMSWRRRSTSAASSSRSWCARSRVPPTSYEIIAGERRWRASQIAGLHEVPIVVLEVSDAEALELAIIENMQRTDLNPLEEARAISR